MSSPRLPVLPTFSSVDRAFACPASEGLPQVNPQSDAADMGQIVDTFLADVTAHGRDAALARVEATGNKEAITLCSGIDVDALDLGQAQHKVTLAINVDAGTARVVGHGLGRAYEDHGVDRTVEVVGELDTVWLTDGFAADVTDWKTGHGREWVKPVRGNGQMMAQALATHLAYHVDHVRQSVFRISHTGHVDRGDAVTWGPADFAAMLTDMRAKVRRYRRLWQKAQETGAWDVFPGPHCTQCKAFAACPAQQRLVRSATNKDNAARLLSDIANGLASGDNAGRAAAYHAVRVLERLTEDVEAVSKAAKEMLVHSARVEPIEIGPGQFYGIRETTKEEIDPAVAWKVLAELHGQDQALLAFDLSTSKTAVGRAAKHQAPNGEGAARERAAMIAIRERGGIKAKTTTRLEVFRKSG